MTTVRAATQKDATDWLRMRAELWPDCDESEHREELESYFSGSSDRAPLIVLIAEDSDGSVLGFAELSIRGYAEGCATNRVAYLEGWFVEATARRKGVGSALVAAAEDWGRERGCIEFASDAEHDDRVSHEAHQSVGFTDIGLVRLFRKDL